MQQFRAGQSVELDFNTNKLSDGTLVTFASGAVKIYRGSDTTGSSTGVTLTIDAGGTGEHHVTVSPLTAAAYLLPGNVYTVRATAGTIDSIAATGAILASFKVERMSAGIEFVLSANAVGGGTATDNGLLGGGDVGGTVTIESGSFPGQPRTVSAWNKSTGVFTVSPNFDNAPGNVTVTFYPGAPMVTTNVPKLDLIDAPNATAITAIVAAVMARLGAPAGASTAADIAAVLAKTPDSAHFTNARGDKLDDLDAVVSSRAAPGASMDIASINGHTIHGDGSGTPFGP